MGWLRYLLYFLAISTAIWLLTQLELASPGSLKFYVTADPSEPLGTSEYSPVEIIQPLILACCAAIMGWVANYCPSQRPLAIPFGAFAVAFLIRELDYFLDRLIVANLWRLLVGVIAALVIVYTYRNLRRLQIALARLWPSPGLTLIFAGAVILFAFVHCVAREELWMSILGSDYRRVAKLAVEEFIELLGYFFWMIGTIEYALQARAIAYREPQPAAKRRRERRRQESEGPY
jgi:hypothetical protein